MARFTGVNAMLAYVHTYSNRADGSRDSFCTIKCDAKEMPLWWHEKGISFTASGYGLRIPSPYMVRFNGKWRRVYICQISNAGSAFIGKSLRDGFTVSIEGD